MKKNIIVIFLIVLSMFTISFGANDHYLNRVEKEKAYERIASKYDSRIKDLSRRLSKKNEEIDKLRGQNAPQNKINESIGERDRIKRELDSVHSEFRNELARNNLSDF